MCACSTFSMPGHVHRQLEPKKYGSEAQLPLHIDTPLALEPKKYGSEAQFPLHIDTMQTIGNKEIKVLQK